MNRNNEQADEPEEWDEAGFEPPPWLDVERDRASAAEPDEDKPEATNQHVAPQSESHEPFPADHPVQYAEDMRNVYDLEESFNAYGRTIYVEQWEETTGKPKIWYEFNKQKILVKYVRGPSSIKIAYLGETKYI